MDPWSWLGKMDMKILPKTLVLLACGLTPDAFALNFFFFFACLLCGSLYAQNDPPIHLCRSMASSPNIGSTIGIYNLVPHRHSKSHEDNNTELSFSYE